MATQEIKDRLKAVKELVLSYIDLVCVPEDKENLSDIVEDCLFEAMHIIVGDKKCKLTAQDIFVGWVKDIFDAGLIESQRNENNESVSEEEEFISQADSANEFLRASLECILDEN